MDWLTVLPDSGYVELNGQVTVENAVDASTLDSGTYVATVFVNSEDATNAPQHYTVTVVVNRRCDLQWLLLLLLEPGTRNAKRSQFRLMRQFSRNRNRTCPCAPRWR